MAKCTNCGKTMGFFATTTICDGCTATLIAEEERLQTENEQQHQIALEKFNKQKDSLLLPKFEELKSKIASGEKIFLYDSIYIPVDSIVNQETLLKEFSLDVLRKVGLQGWEVVGIIPRTLGVSLTNSLIGPTPGSSPESWGAGLGGNVMGVHIILQMEASQRNISDDFLLDYVRRNMDSFLTPDETQRSNSTIIKKYDVNKVLNYEVTGWDARLISIEIFDNKTMVFLFAITNNTGDIQAVNIPKDYILKIYLIDNYGNNYPLIDFKDIVVEPEIIEVFPGKSIQYSFIFPVVKDNVASFSLIDTVFVFKDIQLK